MEIELIRLSVRLSVLHCLLLHLTRARSFLRSRCFLLEVHVLVNISDVSDAHRVAFSSGGVKDERMV